jgi:hypothetical protein
MRRHQSVDCIARLDLLEDEPSAAAPFSIQVLEADSPPRNTSAEATSDSASSRTELLLAAAHILLTEPEAAVETTTSGAGNRGSLRREPPVDCAVRLLSFHEETSAADAPSSTPVPETTDSPPRNTAAEATSESHVDCFIDDCLSVCKSNKQKINIHIFFY